jgi:hypothetical protein
VSDDDVRAKAAFAVAKRAVEGALDDALMSDEERAKKDALAKSQRTKRIAQIVIGGLIVIGLIGLIINYWYWALLLGFLGAGGWYLRRRWRARASRKKESSKKESKPVAALRAPVQAPKKKVRVEPQKVEPLEIPEASIDDDLAELKARMKR